MWKIIWFIAAVLYSLSPIDILPDYHIPILGYADDIAVWVILWKLFSRLKLKPDTDHRNRWAEDGGERPDDSEPDQKVSTPRSPHEVLGVSPQSTPDEIKQAYRRLAGQYHPDKVSHLGEEFKQLAEKRFKEIQDAYQELSSQ